MTHRIVNPLRKDTSLCNGRPVGRDDRRMSRAIIERSLRPHGHET